jgi:hypothetical protein
MLGISLGFCLCTVEGMNYFKESSCPVDHLFNFQKCITCKKPGFGIFEDMVWEIL